MANTITPSRLLLSLLGTLALAPATPPDASEDRAEAGAPAPNETAQEELRGSGSTPSR
jgi:hypothetical protein